MALVRCPDCSKQISTDAARCPECGARNPHRTSARPWLWRTFAWILAAVIVFLGYGCYRIRTNPDAAQRTQERNAIANCEDGYDRATDDPRNSRESLALVYGACAQLKADFRQKWGRDP